MSSNQPTEDFCSIIAQLLQQQQQQQQPPQQGNGSFLPTSQQPVDHPQMSSLISSLLQQQGVNVQDAIASLHSQATPLFAPYANNANGLHTSQSTIGSINPGLASIITTALQQARGVGTQQVGLYQGQVQVRKH